MEEAVASILGERMKRMTAPKTTGRAPELKQTLIISDEGPIKQQMEPVIHSSGENTSQLNVSMQVEGVEIPSTNLYVYDNASYLHKLMKDNTFGRRVRHDAPYTHRLGEYEKFFTYLKCLVSQNFQSKSHFRVGELYVLCSVCL